jgi:putative ubiquitin-RnfH superfamily antitoxin RatB of RatAB toxin-antitoxin module
MKIRIEVVYALADVQTVIEVELEPGSRVADALAAAGPQGAVFGGPASALQIGIWGAPASPESVLRDRDRVEIYRKLQADPKQARRQRARLQRGTVKGG